MILTAIFLGTALLTATAAVVAFWHKIRDWLCTVGADVVERVFGAKGRSLLQKSVVKLNRVIGVIKNRTIVYTKESPNALQYTKLTLEGNISTEHVHTDVLEEFDKNNNELIQTLKYMH